MFDLTIVITGLAVFTARVVDVSLGTMRTIAIVQGRSTMAFALGFIEISIWLWVVSTVVLQIRDNPVLGIFYALGFATGSVVGIKLERRMAQGNIIVRVISQELADEMASTLRRSGFGVTTFQGEGLTGPVTELYIVCRRRDLRNVTEIVKSIQPDAFYITEPAGLVSKVFRTPMQPGTGWRALFKKK